MGAAWRLLVYILLITGLYHIVKSAALLIYNWHDHRKFNKETERLVKKRKADEQTRGD